jgi:hypothetical protein
VWASDANQIGIEDLDWVVFKNDIIEDFLQKRGKYFLSANKGLGKTLLLIYKRKQLTDTYHERQGKSQAQVFFVPFSFRANKYQACVEFRPARLSFVAPFCSLQQRRSRRTGGIS